MDGGNGNLGECCTIAMYVCTFCNFLPELLIPYFSNSWYNYVHWALIIYRIIAEASSKHVISAIQGDTMITYIQLSKMCVQEVTTQYNGISDWYDKTWLCEYNTVNY